ncbi:hypothetical protein F5146DRAFT_423359 [Armillaria mellea]|nr:hypothetical protein F5146DRAFT_423359 [Armillaria mellea]
MLPQLVDTVVFRPLTRASVSLQGCLSNLKITLTTFIFKEEHRRMNSSNALRSIAGTFLISYGMTSSNLLSRTRLCSTSRMSYFKIRCTRVLLGLLKRLTLSTAELSLTALPEQAWAIINHRISTQSSASETFEHDTQLLISLAERFNLTYTAFGKDISQSGVPTKGSLTLSSPGYLDIAPLTPTTGNEAAPYKLLSGTIKATYNAHRSLEGDNIVVGPGMPTNSGNGTNSLGGGAHTVNESISADSFVEMILFYTTLILNVDETTDL